ncbi:heme exporter protein C [Amorphus suaedae]
MKLANVSATSQSTLQSLANPTRFVAIVDGVLPWLLGVTLVLFAVGLPLAFFMAPADYQQGQTIRIMFVHVPAAWIGMFCYVVMASAALGSLVWKHPLGDVAARAAAPIGAAFTLICLVTGSLWGRPMWGAWWVWDARLTSMLVLFLMYLGLIALWHTIEDPIRAGRVAAILILVGVINIPIIKFSVDWWYTLHQPASVFRFDGPTIYVTMLIPLLVMAVAFMGLFGVLHLIAMKNEILRRRIRAIGMRAAYEGRRGEG